MVSPVFKSVNDSTGLLMFITYHILIIKSKQYKNYSNKKNILTNKFRNKIKCLTSEPPRNKIKIKLKNLKIFLLLYLHNHKPDDS